MPRYQGSDMQNNQGTDIPLWLQPADLSVNPSRGLEMLVSLKRPQVAASIAALLAISASAAILLGYDVKEEPAATCKLTPLEETLWSGGEDAKREKAISAIQSHLSSLNETERPVAEAVLGYWQAGSKIGGYEASRSVAGNSVVRFAQFIHYMRSDQYTKATDTLQSAITSGAFDCADKWDSNNRRYMIAHRLLRNKDYEGAYQIASHHGSKLNITIAQFEWLAGYTKMRSHDAKSAAPHFQNALKVSGTPISRSRNLYWLGRAYDAAGDAENSRKNYNEAAQYGTAFYGQLAAAKINKTIRFAPNPYVSSSIPDYTETFRKNTHFKKAEAAFENQDMATFDESLRNFMGDLFRDKTYQGKDRQTDLQKQVVFLTRYANQNGAAATALRLGKQASGLGAVIPELMFPKPSAFYGQFAQQATRNGLPVSLVAGLARRESEFDPKAQSGVGARGLMQIMPDTAVGENFVATADKRYYDPKVWAQNPQLKTNITLEAAAMLLDPDYNITTGSAYLGSLVNRYGGSIVMAVGAYNAGPAKMDRWAMDIGDPRTLHNADDMIDFLESIPYEETREYIMRVTEGMVAYDILLGNSANLATVLTSGDVLAGTEIQPLPFKIHDNPPSAVGASYDQCPSAMFQDEAAHIKGVPASLTKMMTQYIFALTMKDPAFSLNMDSVGTVTPFVIRQSMGLASFEVMKPGMQYTARDLLAGSGAKSDARSTVMLALMVADARGWKGTEAQKYARFVQEMRDQSKRLRMEDTLFMNATGDRQYTNNRGNYSTPYDMMKLIRAFAADAPVTFEATLGQSVVNIPMTSSPNPSSRFLSANPSDAIGAKTGYLASAGFNEAIKVRFGNGMTGTIVMFGADTPDDRYKTILDTYKRMNATAVAGKACP